MNYTKSRIGDSTAGKGKELNPRKSKKKMFTLWGVGPQSICEGRRLVGPTLLQVSEPTGGGELGGEGDCAWGSNLELGKESPEKGKNKPQKSQKRRAVPMGERGLLVKEQKPYPPRAKAGWNWKWGGTFAGGDKVGRLSQKKPTNCPRRDRLEVPKNRTR